MKYYVDTSSNNNGDGTKKYPYKTIQQAANVAIAGDEIIVANGIYREHVIPINAGRKDAPIVYRAMEPLGAIITGAEPLKNWKNVEADVWMIKIDNSLFNDYNPYTTLVSGDWLIPGFSHTGDVFLNNKSMYEVETLEAVKNPVIYEASWDSSFTKYVWYTMQDEDNNKTIIYANFQGKNPNDENVEISVRRNCFMPIENGINYITLSGFTVREAATQWAPPTAYQDGMIGPHWSKGWIIEDCEIYESKCSGISLGKYLQPYNDNKWSKWKYKDGTQTERDCICRASYEGWDKEHVGSHVIRRCNIHDCGQAGIVGHLGGVFSLIEDNHIHHINNKQNISGAEIGGIKMHAAIDVIFRNNHIHNCTRGLWLDWQAQGTRVTGNLFHDNCLATDRTNLSLEDPIRLFGGMGEDIFVEVSHGPTLIDNNILLSERALKLAAQGISVIHNLIAGSLTCVGTGTNNGAEIPSPRYTPYHRPHGTAIDGFMTILHGDVHFINNIFVQKPIYSLFKTIQEMHKTAPDSQKQWDTNNFECGTEPYSEYPTFEEWDKLFDGWNGMGSSNNPDRYYKHLPVWIKNNYYFNGAKPSSKDINPNIIKKKVQLELKEDKGNYTLVTNLYDYVKDSNCDLINTDALGMAFEPEEKYENPDGSPIIFNIDIQNEKRVDEILPGPFANARNRYELLLAEQGNCQ